MDMAWTVVSVTSAERVAHTCTVPLLPEKSSVSGNETTPTERKMRAQ